MFISLKLEEKKNYLKKRSNLQGMRLEKNTNVLSIFDESFWPEASKQEYSLILHISMYYQHLLTSA